MKYLLITLILCVFPRSSLSEDFSFKYGLGIIDGSATTAVKAFAVRMEEGNLFLPLHSAVEGGLWTDTGEAAGRKGAGYATYQLGVKPSSEHFYVKAYWGAAILTKTDSQLGGILQFKTDFGVGFRDRHSFVGIGLGHISSAGIFRPNKGRDAIQFELGWKW